MLKQKHGTDAFQSRGQDFLIMSNPKVSCSHDYLGPMRAYDATELTICDVAAASC